MRRSRWGIGVCCMSILQWVSISARASLVRPRVCAVWAGPRCSCPPLGGLRGKEGRRLGVQRSRAWGRHCPRPCAFRRRALLDLERTQHGETTVGRAAVLPTLRVDLDVDGGRRIQVTVQNIGDGAVTNRTLSLKTYLPNGIPTSLDIPPPLRSILTQRKMVQLLAFVSTGLHKLLLGTER